MRNTRYAVVILDSTGRPTRRLSVAHTTLLRGAWLVALAGMMVLVCACHGLWAQRQASVAQRLLRDNAGLRGLTHELVATVPAAREAASLAELNFAHLWSKSRLGLEPGLLDVAPATAPSPLDEADAGAAFDPRTPLGVFVPPGIAAPSNVSAPPGDAIDEAHSGALNTSESVFAQTAVALVPVNQLEIHNLRGAVRHLTAEARELSTTLGDTLEYFRDAERMLLNTPSIRPAHAAWYSSSFGIRLHPITHVLLMHKGLDMGGFVGMEIFAPADGVVIWSGRRGGYGQVVVIDHGYGLQTHFAHLSKYLVKSGQHVKRGQHIAEMGTTGHSTGPHLHYEVRRYGQPLDPRRFILD